MSRQVNGLKVCNTCLEVKPISEYMKDKTRHDGLCSRCRICESLRKRVFPYRAGSAKKVAKYEANNKEKRCAWRALKAAKDAGTVIPWPVCAIPECATSKVHAHHADYSRPLDVVWLCPAHHKQAHKAHL